MFNVREGGDSVPIKWGEDQLKSDRSVIILDESSLSLYLWHGTRQGLVARRTALRQAQSLKGHGYTIGKSIIGRDIKTIKEIDSRKVGRVPEETELNNELQAILKREFKELEDFIVTFQIGEIELEKQKVKPTVKKQPAPQMDIKLTPKEVPKPAPKAKPSKKLPLEAPKVKPAAASNISAEAKVGFVIMGILDHFDDLWISKKDDGFSIEMMEGPVALFSVIGGKIKFSANSFSGLAENIKNDVQKKFIELSKLLK